MGENCWAKEVQPGRSGAVQTRALPGRGLTETLLGKGPRQGELEGGEGGGRVTPWWGGMERGLREEGIH